MCISYATSSYLAIKNAKSKSKSHATITLKLVTPFLVPSNNNLDVYHQWHQYSPEIEYKF